MELQERFVKLLLYIGFESSQIKPLWTTLEKAYTSKSRHYHNLTHLDEMIALYDLHYSELQFPNEVLYAIFYHDYVYKVTKKDNELKSAEYAMSILPTHTTLNQTLIFDMIYATQLHQHQTVEDINWLIDFDLKILAKDWNDYEVYTQQIRKEYKIYPNLLYNPCRKKALQHFLENDFIYQTKIFRKQYETQARANIQKEIKTI